MTTTYWIPLTADRWGRVRLDVVEEGLPSPHERPIVCALTGAEVERISRALAHGEYRTQSPFDMQPLD